LEPRVERIIEIPSSAAGVALTRGLVEVSSQDGELHVAALRIGAGGGYAAVEPLALASGDSSPVAQVIPRFTHGDGWTTAVTLVNTGAEPLPAAVIFRQPDGAPVPLPLDSGESAADYSDVIPPGGSRLVQTSSEGRDRVDGWVEVIAARSIAALAVLRYRHGEATESEVSVPLVQPGQRRLAMFFDNMENLSTWLGFVNPDWSADSTVGLNFRDERGSSLGAGSVRVEPRTSQFVPLPVRIPMVLDRRGLVEIRGYNLDLAAVGARSNANGTIVAVPLLWK
jgi:hypothetical protein